MIFVHVYEVRPRKDHRGVDLISDVLPFGRLWYDTPDNAIGYAMHSSRSHGAVIRVYDDAGNVTETHEYKGDFSVLVIFLPVKGVLASGEITGRSSHCELSAARHWASETSKQGQPLR